MKKVIIIFLIIALLILCIIIYNKITFKRLTKVTINDSIFSNSQKEICEYFLKFIINHEFGNAYYLFDDEIKSDENFDIKVFITYCIMLEKKFGKPINFIFSKKEIKENNKIKYYYIVKYANENVTYKITFNKDGKKIIGYYYN